MLQRVVTETPKEPTKTEEVKKGSEGPLDNKPTHVQPGTAPELRLLDMVRKVTYHGAGRSGFAGCREFLINYSVFH